MLILNDGMELTCLTLIIIHNDSMRLEIIDYRLIEFFKLNRVCVLLGDGQRVPDRTTADASLKLP